MIAKLAAAALAAALAAGALWALPLLRGPAPAELAPRDVPPDPHPLPDRPLRIAVLGTSLSHNEVWTIRLGEALSPCLGSDPEIHVAAFPGADIASIRDTGLIGPMVATDPDIVLIEFAVNDADLRDGPGRAEADRLTRALLAELGGALPGALRVEMTMSPATGLRGLLRPWLEGHYADAVARAGAGASDGAVDLYRRWLALPRGSRGLGDGLHPDPEVTAAVIVSPLAGYIAAAFGRTCSARGSGNS
ncbi:hypothetical protein HKCCE3408_17085 [Rhodobacterales bacterium HKCCE3408]|nr:hypothetical protein [Rhodobacterales bacterium HKCCE3408]